MEQVKVVAERFVNIPVDLIVASHYQRAKESAEIVGKKVGVKIRYSNVFKEMKRPTEM
jgi:broad specificity phosphatase PhoE